MQGFFTFLQQNPYLLLFFVFLLLPLGYGLWLSFMKYELTAPGQPQFIGLSNYREAMHDPYFWQALRATFRFVIAAGLVPPTVAIRVSSSVRVPSTQCPRRTGRFARWRPVSRCGGVGEGCVRPAATSGLARFCSIHPPASQPPLFVGK